MTLLSELQTIENKATHLLFLLPLSLFPVHQYELDINVTIHLTNGIESIHSNTKGVDIKLPTPENGS